MKRAEFERDLEQLRQKRKELGGEWLVYWLIGYVGAIPERTFTGDQLKQLFDLCHEEEEGK